VVRDVQSAHQFRNAFKGSIIVPGDVDYDRTRAVASVTQDRQASTSDCSMLECGGAACDKVWSARSGSPGAGEHDLLGASVCD
jgi:hypothetical protein